MRKQRSLRLIAQKRAYLSTAIAAFVVSLIVSSLNAQEPTGLTSEQVELRLQQRISATWQGQQLGTIIRRLVDTQGLTIWVDRRVDLQQIIELRLTDASLLQALEMLAKQQVLGVTILNGIVYVGPENSARELRTLSKLAHDSLKNVSTAARKPWLHSESYSWPRLSQPKTLLENILQDANLRLTGTDLIAHDLWSAKHLPAVSLIDRIVLILVGFDLTCDISNNGTTCEVIPIERPVVLKRNYKLPKNSQVTLNKLKLAIPDGIFEVQENLFSFTGRWEGHLRVEELLGKRATRNRKPPSRRSATTAEKTFSLQLQNQPVGVVIGQLAKQLKLEVVWNEESLAAAGISKDTPVSCRVKDANLKQLLKSVLTPAGLQFERTDKQIKISAKQ